MSYIHFLSKIFFMIIGIFPNTFLQPVNGSKISIFPCVLFFLFLKHPLKISHSVLLFFVLFGLDTIQTCIKESCMYLSGQLFFKLSIKLPNSKKTSRKMHFPAICRPKFKSFPLRCLPWGHPTEPLN